MRRKRCGRAYGLRRSPQSGATSAKTASTRRLRRQYKQSATNRGLPMTQDKRSLVRRTLSELYWRVRWWATWHVKRQVNRHDAKLREKEDARRIAECPLFDVRWYLELYPDVGTSGVDPAMHY